MKLKIAWRGRYPSYVGVGDTQTTKEEHGVKDIVSTENFKEFCEYKEVEYGEQGGTFRILFGWAGNLNSDDSKFYSEQELHNMLR